MPTFRSPPAPTRRCGARCASRRTCTARAGSTGPSLPEPTTKVVDGHAADFLAELIEPGVVLVPTGPLTNVALMLERHPDVRDRLERIVWMGGAIAEGNVTPAAEFNAFVDPEAAAIVFGSGIPVTMIGLDITHKALFTRAHADRLRDTGAAGRVVAELSDFFQRFHESRYGFDGSPIHDALAVAHVIDPTLVTTLNCNIAIETASAALRRANGRRSLARAGRRAAERPRRHRRRRRPVPRAARRADRLVGVIP